MLYGERCDSVQVGLPELVVWQGAAEAAQWAMHMQANNATMRCNLQEAKGPEPQRMPCAKHLGERHPSPSYLHIITDPQPEKQTGADRKVLRATSPDRLAAAVA